MKVVTIASSKGGTGKSTAATVLAARAVQDGHRVALFDLNGDQASLTFWWYARGEPDNPLLYEVENLTQAVDSVAQEGVNWLFIDTPPLDIDLVENAVVLADAVIVPVRASIFDTSAITPIVEMCRKRRKPYSFLMSAVDPKFKKLNEAMMADLLQDGPIFAAKLTYRLPYINSLTAGKAGFEIDADLRPEVDALWMEVQRLASTTAPLALTARRGVAHD